MTFDLSNIFKLFLLVILSIPYITSYAQVDSSLRIITGKFPDSWDKKRNLRSRNGKILAWVHFKSGEKFENKVCLQLVYGPDSTGNIEYFISEMYTNKKPFKKWNYEKTRYENYSVDTITGLKFGYWDIHLEVFKHKPTEEELYSLFKKWKFRFLENDPDMVEAGLDDKLWLLVFGFSPNRKLLTAPK